MKSAIRGHGWNITKVTANSRQLPKTIVSDKGRAVFNGLINARGATRRIKAPAEADDQ